MEFDVVIIGGGFVGLPLASALAKKGLKCALVDIEDRSLRQKKDRRAIAISYGSKLLLEEMGVWQVGESDTQPIFDICVFEHNSPWNINYQHNDISINPMGYIVEGSVLRDSFSFSSHENLAFFTPDFVKSIDYQEHKAVITLNSEAVLETSLVIGAEGRFSPTRFQSTIQTKTWDYDQNIFVGQVYHEKNHEGKAWEIFFPDGPLALLPMCEDEELGHYRSGVVWGKKKKFQWKSLSIDEIKNQLEEAFPFYGPLILDKNFSNYKITGLWVNKVFDHRLALIGDAAHVVHPIAGQGLNLGWRDIYALFTLLLEAKNLGLDIGGYPLLRAYDHKRKKDRIQVLSSTDLIYRLFSNQSSLLYGLRNTGFALVNSIKPLKKFFMEKAIGLNYFNH